MHKLAIRTVAAALCLSLACGCISTWNRFPSARSDSVADTKIDETLYYDDRSVKGMFSGAQALKTVLREDTPFRNTEARNEVPERGIFVRVEAKRIPPHTGSGVFGYISYALLFVIPFWSTEGYTMRYQVFVDAKEKRIFEYDITRRTFVWLVALPVSWVSLLTPSESDAFNATAYQFFQDSAPYLSGDRNWP